jgi:dihydrofolate reductase
VEIKCSIFIATSVDGFIARKNGAIDWLIDNSEANDKEDYGYKDFLNSVDAIVMGRKTYEVVRSFQEWPYTDKNLIVLSRRNPGIPETLTPSVKLMSGTPNEIVKKLSEFGVRHLYIDGGKTIQGFLQAGFINEMTITKIPILLGEGIPLFASFYNDIKLRHIRTKVFENGFVQNMYRVL